ncbi:ankyrin repeat domain-containing protein [Rubrivirga sp. IMCC43871]|uniref:ankyrin repeat domain-containing protein n=1 Tax=Rubrivirga sp. IMCC43871 TaxID=3391575 RepID=UPI0039901C03
MHGPTAALLVSAVESGAASLVTELLVSGADPNTTFDDDRPPNAAWGDADGMRYPGRGRPVLHLAVLCRHEPVVRVLLERGATVDLEDQGELTALVLAVRTEQVNVVRTLLEWGASPEALYPGGRLIHLPLLFWVAGAANLNDGAAAELIALFAEFGADVEGGAEKGEATPLMAAASKSCLPCVEALLRAGADPNRATAEGHTALTASFRTSMTGYSRRRREGRAVGQALINGGSDPGAGFNPVMLAAQQGRSKWVRAALKAGVPVDRALPDGRTALHLAAAGGFIAVVRALLEAGADPNATDRDGRTALSMALEEGAGSTVWDRSRPVESDVGATIRVLELAA